MTAEDGPDPRGLDGGWTPRPDPTTLTTQLVDRAIGSFREVVETRLDGMDRAAEVLDQTVNRTPTVIQSAIANVREVYDERFRSVQQQFSERDVRTEQAATASASALAAALQAAKEAVFEQAQAAAKAAEKTELSFTKQIDQIGLQIATVAKGFDDRITELKERIDRGEGQGAGQAQSRVEQGQSRLAGNSQLMAVIAGLAVLVAVASVIVLAFKK